MPIHDHQQDKWQVLFLDPEKNYNPDITTVTVVNSLFGLVLGINIIQDPVKHTRSNRFEGA